MSSHLVFLHRCLQFLGSVCAGGATDLTRAKIRVRGRGRGRGGGRGRGRVGVGVGLGLGLGVGLVAANSTAAPG